jgi:hypothetical protein
MPLKFGGTFESGPAGLAQVKWLPKSQLWKIIMDKDPDDTYKLPPEDVPMWTREGHFNVMLNKELTELRSLRPTEAGNIPAVLDRFISKEGEPPAPVVIPAKVYEKNGKRGTIDAHLEFRIVYRMCEPYANFEITFGLWYAFKKAKEGDWCDVAGNGSQRLALWLQTHGYTIEDTIPFSANVLPWLANDIFTSKKAGEKPVMLKYDGSWIKDVESLPMGIPVPAIPAKLTKPAVGVVQADE